MRLLKQSFLYFKEGNSDKVYEIDLCDTGNDTFVVNFRYGKRGSLLKEGTKTPSPVALAEAEKIFDAVETEKLNKGYTTAETGEPVTKTTPAFSLDENVETVTGWTAWAPGKNKAILLRLQNAANGNSNEKSPWKLSRVIWKAGEYKITEATAYIIRLFNNGNQLHQYCCTWALARCCENNPVAIAALKNIYSNHPVQSIAKIAGAGLIKHLPALEKESQLNHYINRLPEPFKQLAEAENSTGLEALIRERLLQQQPNYNWLEDLYLLSTENKWMRPAIKKALQQLPLRPNYFKHVRAVFKLSELVDDFEMTGLLAVRFEREPEMFSHNLNLAADANSEIFVPQLDEWVKLQKELKKVTSRLAYSQKTRWYFHHRIVRRLIIAGKNDNTDYVKLATALLINYKYQLDYKAHYSTSNYVYTRNGYQLVETRFLQNAQAVFLHQVLSGHNPQITLQSGRLWRMRAADEKNPAAKKSNHETGASTDSLGGFLKKLTGLFSKKKQPEIPTQPEPAPAPETPVNKNGTPFLHLWNKVPQAYVQLLMNAEMEEVHQFAEENLSTHPEYAGIKTKLDKQAVKRLLSSPFQIPARVGFALAEEKYSNNIPDDDLVTALLNSVHEPAQNKGMQWAEAYKTTYLQQAAFITGLIFAEQVNVRPWVKSLLGGNEISPEVKNTVTGKSIATLMGYEPATPQNEGLIPHATEMLFDLFSNELKQVNIGVLSDLLQHQHAGVLLFGLRLLKIQKQQLELNTLSTAFLSGLLNHSHTAVREEGIALLQAMNAEASLQHRDELIAACLSAYGDVRKGIAPVIGRMAQKDPAFGVRAAEILMPVLLRKETNEGLHGDVSKLLCNELSGFLQNANKETALNLLYSNYNAAQNVGVMILEKYTDPSQLTMPQVIALGGHENLNVREWCWNFYRQQTARIKYEKEAAIKLLESKWQDTRQFAMQYFREQFDENDWNPDTLITLADSVKPDVEAFGRELITRFFNSENGVGYLLKLSQHPGEKMQLFATNYLERFAADDVSKIQSLDFYFRSVLTRVNKSRVAKNRIYHFLLTEGRKSEAAAKLVSALLAEVSAITAIGDKAKCIDILLQLKSLYDISSPVKVKEPEQRSVAG